MSLWNFPRTCNQGIADLRADNAGKKAKSYENKNDQKNGQQAKGRSQFHYLRGVASGTLLADDVSKI